MALGPLSVFKREGTESRPSTAVKREGSDCFGPVVKREVSDVEGRNRDLLAKMVVARMKACGIRDYRSKSIMPITAAVMSPVLDENEERREKEEYKNIYHHTVKAATFALVGFPSSESLWPWMCADLLNRETMASPTLP